MIAIFCIVCNTNLFVKLLADLSPILRLRMPLKIKTISYPHTLWYSKEGVHSLDDYARRDIYIGIMNITPKR